jgi:hypothetical protein
LLFQTFPAMHAIPNLSRGEEKKFVLAARPRPSFAKPFRSSFASRGKGRGKRSAERRIQPLSALTGAEARQNAGRARLPALHCGTRQRSRNRLWLSSRTTFPGTRLGRVFCPPRACPVQRAPRRPVLLPAKWCPEAARVRGANPPAGTALAPQSGMPRDSVPRMSKMRQVVT